MSLASVCNSVALLVGVQASATWAGNADVSAAELVAWVNEAQGRVAEEHDWQVLLRRPVPVALPAPDGDGVMAVTLPADLDRLVPDGVWLTGQRRRVVGPLSPAAWEEERRAVRVSATPVFTIAGGQLLVRSTSGAGEGLGFGYVARVVPYTADAQVTALGEKLERAITLCAVALYRDAKGLPPGTAAGQYATTLARAKAKDTPTGAMSLARLCTGRDGGGTGRNSTFILDESNME